jgi:hypothetical protein
MTEFVDRRSIILETGASSGTLGGYFKFSFNGQAFSFPANAAYWQDADCELSVESLPNVHTATCAVTSSGRHGATSYLISFLTFPTYPYENNMYTNDGNPSIDDFACDSTGVTGASGVTCVLSDVAGTALPGSFIDILFIFILLTSVLRIYLLLESRDMRLQHGHLRVLRGLHQLELRHVQLRAERHRDQYFR